MKVAGTVHFPWIAYSPSDTVALGFFSLKDAEKHAERMNDFVKLYPGNPWSIKYWPTKPEPWVVEENPK